MHQFDTKGRPLTSPTNDYGVFQINVVHLKQAKAMGLDIKHSEEDNITMAMYLYDTQGPQIWSTYRACAEDTS